ncbi:hypothetical protein QTO34_010489 [Cnephaeus nilssonii]|uniref:Dermokine n=1 Tax=Cnephaeus nilssonii TaxID=3371016 RepID=A0AA40LEB5_CNENI|nr:hypothetical protein QTO34_010489 [Eptesicus nilssonii]
MKFQGSLACLLLALYLGSGEAGPLLSGGASAGTGVGEAAGQAVGDAISHGIREAIGQGAGEAAHALGNTGSEAGTQTENIIRHGIDAAHGSWQGVPGRNSAWGTNGQPPSEATAPLVLRVASEPKARAILKVQGIPGSMESLEAQGAALEPTLKEAPGPRRQRRAIQRGDQRSAVAQPGYGSVRGNSNTECTNPPPSGSGGSSSNSWGSSGGSSDSSGGGSNSGSTRWRQRQQRWGSGSNGGRQWWRQWRQQREAVSAAQQQWRSRAQPASSDSSGSSSGSGGRWQQRGGSALAAAVARARSSGAAVLGQLGSSGGSGGGNKPGCDNPGNDVRVAGSGAQEISREGSRLVGNSQGNYQNSQTSPGLFNFDTFWKNFKSKLGFINWDAINKGQVPSPSTRALLYFSRLWEDFKHNTPFLNWKAIIEDDYSSSSLQKRAGNAGQNYNYNQQAYPTVSGGQYSAKVPAKASRARPGLLQWVKFW